jgi:hypothetical protein
MLNFQKELPLLHQKTLKKQLNSKIHNQLWLGLKQHLVIMLLENLSGSNL